MFTFFYKVVLFKCFRTENQKNSFYGQDMPCELTTEFRFGQLKDGGAFTGEKNGFRQIPGKYFLSQNILYFKLHVHLLKIFFK